MAAEITYLNTGAIIVIETNFAPVQSVNGKTGHVTISGADFGVDNVDNTRDIDKPLSIPVSGYLDQLEQRILGQVQLASNDDIKFNITLESGIENRFIPFPVELSGRPFALNCQIENNVDSVIYNHSISNVSKSGFFISFSDVLSNEGYILNIHAGI
jgi:hypothetical protein